MTKTRTENVRRIAAGRHGSGSAPPPGGNLPLETTSFVGRERELSEVEGLLGQTRLLTLTGAGGSGKTRLALRSAGGLGAGFGDGAWWADLASLPDADLVPRRTASALGVAESPERSTVELVVEYLEPRKTLLVLDNCEHVIGACADLADALLRSCPDLSILATSREPLGVPGEVSLPVPPLSLPDARRGRTLEELLRCESVGLFVERAGAVVPGFSLTAENAATVAALCARLDGMPLAIELAASRARMLSVRQILDRLDERFRLLTGGRTSAPRHKSLGATIDWSYDLLSEGERVLFCRLSVFSGGFTLEAAEEVCSGGGISGADVLELLSGLVDKSLVVAARNDKATRYRMLETIRQYAAEKLEQSGGAEDVGRRHADFFVVLAEEAKPGMVGPEQAAWLQRLEEDHDNLRAALGRLEGEGDADRGLRLAAALVRFWWFRGHPTEGRAWLERMLRLSTTAVRDEVRAKALRTLGALSYMNAEHAASAWEVARQHLGESLEIYRRLGDERGAAAVLQNLGRISAELGEWEAAYSALDESLAIGRRLENGPGIALSLFNLGHAHLLEGDLPSARARLEEGLENYRNLDDKFWIDACLVHLGYIDCEEGAYAAARSRFVQMGETLPLVQFPAGATYTLDGFARLAAAEGEPGRALRLGGATQALRRTYGVTVGPTGQDASRRALEPAWRALGTEAGEKAWEEGLTMTLEKALDLAFAEPGTELGLHLGCILSDRELEVLQLVAGGLTDAQVAENLYLSPRTVGAHLRSTYRKLGVKSRIAAVRKASELDLL